MLIINNFERDGYSVYPIIIPANPGLLTYNFFLVKHNQSLTLIDAGIPSDSCWEGLMETLEKNGFYLQDITEILLTHHHIDHVGVVNRITEQHPIPVYAHPLAIPRVKRDPEFLNTRIAFFEQFYQEMDCGEEGAKQVDYLKKSVEKNAHLKLTAAISPLEEGMRIFDFYVKEVPGHAPDQIALVDERRRWCFGGDHLIQHISSNALVEPDFMNQRIRSLVDYKQSLKAFMDLNVDLVFAGHGEMIEDPKQLIEMRLSRIVKKSEKIKGLIQSGISTGSKLAKQLYQSQYQKQFSLVMSEVVGHLDALEADKQIEKQMKDGVWHYRVV
ncbi:MBL fold metallo-hydrolase [Alkalihalobacillus sp. BA299]|uniref:MBL fold metallo-hydrolase n=1 Tax=Alkalihalobacillus sp. BA299 TaxID=2815938 RepID=UPI0027DD9E57|nr:MBL fold metallo-hydrolase [Alkalihalobacillus sp. BA299]